MIATSTTELNRGCNCNVKANCPLPDNCLAVNSLYIAKVDSSLTNYKEKHYVGVCEPIFKSRYLNHNTSFNLREYEKSSEL